MAHQTSKKKHKCPHYNDGWCYPGTADTGHNVCVQTWNCSYFKRVIRKLLWKERDNA